MANWQSDPIQLITVTLYDHGFLRYHVSGEDSHGVAGELVIWARSEEAVERHMRRVGVTNPRIRLLPRALFQAEVKPGRAFRGSESGETLYKVESSGDRILWPEYADDQKAEADQC